MAEENDENMQAVMGLIINGGNAKSSAFEAIAAAKKKATLIPLQLSLKKLTVS